jgi:recombination protein U
MRNPGKTFEDDFKRSVPKDMYYLRLHDSATGFGSTTNVRFSLKSPYDAILCQKGQMVCVELKSVGGTSASFGETKNSVIKLRQIRELWKAEKEGSAISYLVIHFRKYGETYAIRPKDFTSFLKGCKKKSVNRADCKGMGRLLPERSLRVHKRYDLSVLFS